jgi:hypothetical protein
MSPKSIAEKLLIKPATTVWTSDPEHLELIEPLPQDVRVVDRLGEATTALLFADDADSRPIAQVSMGDVWSADPLPPAQGRRGAVQGRSAVNAVPCMI